LRECLAIREKSMPDDFSGFIAMSQLGAALLGQAKSAESEPLVVGGYEGLKAHEAEIPAAAHHILTDAAGRVLRLHRACRTLERTRACAEQLTPPLCRPPSSRAPDPESILESTDIALILSCRCFHGDDDEPCGDAS
jgi:hypothetical protein